MFLAFHSPGNKFLDRSFSCAMAVSFSILSDIFVTTQSPNSLTWVLCFCTPSSNRLMDSEFQFHCPTLADHCVSDAANYCLQSPARVKWPGSNVWRRTEGYWPCDTMVQWRTSYHRIRKICFVVFPVCASSMLFILLCVEEADSSGEGTDEVGYYLTEPEWWVYT
jgi:hypothetical protein